MLASKDKKIFIILQLSSPLQTIYAMTCCVSKKPLQSIDENQDSAEKQPEQWTTPMFPLLISVSLLQQDQPSVSENSQANLTTVCCTLLISHSCCPIHSLSHVLGLHSFTSEKVLHLSPTSLFPFQRAPQHWGLQSNILAPLLSVPPLRSLGGGHGEEVVLTLFYWRFKAYGLNALNAMEDYCHMS